MEKSARAGAASDTSSAGTKTESKTRRMIILKVVAAA
jgi:hypothetical protein